MALCQAELGKACVPNPRVPFPWCSTHPGARLEPAARQLAAGTPNGQARPPAPHTGCLCSLQSCANRNSRYFITLPLFFSEGTEKPKMVCQLCPLHFSLTEKPLLAVLLPQSSSTCPAPPAQRREDFLISVSLNTIDFSPVLALTCRNILLSY